MIIRIVAIGRTREQYLESGIAEYRKRLLSRHSLEFVEVTEERIPQPCSDADRANITRREGERLLQAAGKTELRIALDPAGMMWSSEDLAGHLSRWEMAGRSPVTFLIGGPLGLSDAVKQTAEFCISLSRMTFPHQLVRLILVEQIYRADQINRGLPYHK